MDTPREEKRLRGIGVSPGVARAEAHVVRHGVITPVPHRVRVDDLDAEWDRLKAALEVTRQQVAALKRRLDEAGEGREAGIFDAHLLILEDEVFLGEVERVLREDRLAVDAAFIQVVSRYEEALAGVDDGYLRERAVDMQDVAQRVLRNLHAAQGAGALAPVVPDDPHVIVARDLNPSDTADMDRDLVRGFVTELGSQTSHTAIIARSLGIPAVVGLPGITRLLQSGADMLVDGYLGLVIVNPTLETLKAYQRLEAQRSRVSAGLAELRDEPAQTLDGKRIKLAANIEFLRELPILREQGAEGVGLYRTEFFYLKSDVLPTESEQYSAYCRVVAEAGRHGVIFRTVDIGGDKLPGEARRQAEPNPFLGWRGIRISLAEEEVFRTQLRAILRASAAGPVKVMFPMITTVGEVRQARRILNECADELRAEGVAVDDEIEVGIMIEVPGTAVAADTFAGEVDFFSIGSNDLTQYTLAVDRVNERVADLYQPMSLGVLRLMATAVDAAREAKIWTGVCGEVAGDVLFTPLLIGMGVDELSVGPRQVLRVKRAVRGLDSKACGELFAKVRTGEVDAATACLEMAREAYPDLLD